MTRHCIEHTLKVTLYLDSVTVSLFVQVKWNQRNPNHKYDFETSLKIHPSLSTGRRVGGLGREGGCLVRQRSQSESRGSDLSKTQ